MAIDNSKKLLNDAIIRNIGDAIESLGYGTVTIKIQESKIVQIDVTERQRFDEAWKLEDGAGI